MSIQRRVDDKVKKEYEKKVKSIKEDIEKEKSEKQAKTKRNVQQGLQASKKHIDSERERLNITEPKPIFTGVQPMSTDIQGEKVIYNENNQPIATESASEKQSKLISPYTTKRELDKWKATKVPQATTKPEK